ncbi:MAG TPA: HTTM domain-containing protein, partial [Gemmatimonadaceae bacterium]
PWPAAGMYAHFAFIAFAGLLVAAGIWYRISAWALWASFTYVFLIDQARYLNHFYAASLFALLLAVVPAHHAYSFDAKRKHTPHTVPTWALWLLRAQLGAIYFFGGIAKLNSDWLRGEPMRSWLIERTNSPVIGAIVGNQLELIVFSYGGLLFDLLVVPALLWRRTRLVAFVIAILFHFINSQIFSIGIFPIMMIVATTLFFEPNWPRRWFGEVAERGSAAAATRRQFGLPLTFGSTPPLSRSTALLIGAYVLIQIVVPLRHFAYPGDVAWTEEGHRFAWRMMLREKQGAARFFVTDSATHETMIVEPNTRLALWQVTAMTSRPDMLLQFARYLAAERAGPSQSISVRAQVLVSLNRGEQRLLIDPQVDLSHEARTLWPASWITRGTGSSGFGKKPGK